MWIRAVKSALAAAALVSGVQTAAAAEAKNVILMISDGGGFNHFKLTDLYTGSTPVYEGGDFVKFGMQTYSASRPVPYDSALMFNGTSAFAESNFTDSASAATAMYTGVKNFDGEVNWATNDTPLTTYFEHAANAGHSIGAVTSVEFSHATPAAVYGHNSSRNNYAAIGTEGVYGSNPVNDLGNSGSNPLAGDNNNYNSANYNGNLKVLMGAGSGDYTDNGAYNTGTSDNYVGGTAAWTDITTPPPPNGWTLVESKAAFEAVASGGVAGAPNKLLGVAQAATTLQQGRSNPAGNFDPMNSNVPTLETMTKAALNVLAKDTDGFAVMIEGGAVDWAGHANQADRVIEEQVDFNASVKAVVDFINVGGDDIDWSNTLLIVTADHETGNLWGAGSTDSTPYQFIDTAGAAALADVQFLSGDHTNALVPLYAKGVGSELFANYVIDTENIWARYGVGTAGFADGAVGYIDNTSIYHVMAGASGIPEPSSMVLLALSTAALLRRRRS